MQIVKYNVPTPFGIVAVWSLGKHAFKAAAEDGLQLNRIDYKFDVQFDKQDDESWDWKKTGSLYLRRKDGKEWSFNAHDKLIKVVFPILFQWVKDNPDFMKRGELMRLQSQVREDESEIGEKRQAIALLIESVTRRQKQIKDLQKELAMPVMS